VRVNVRAKREGWEKGIVGNTKEPDKVKQKKKMPHGNWGGSVKKGMVVPIHEVWRYKAKVERVKEVVNFLV